MKIIKGVLVSIIASSLIVILSLYLTGNKFILSAFQKTYLSGYRTANINDHSSFNTNTIAAGKHIPLTANNQYKNQALPQALEDELNSLNSAALLILHNGELISEHYLNGYNERSKLNSFSMAKTVTTLLVGIAIEEGYIKSLDQRLTDFLPEFKDDPLAEKATIGQLSLMNSGYEWTEHYYSILSPTVELYYGSDVTDFLTEGHFSEEPTTFWEYSSASTQLLGIVLLRALQKANAADSLSDYLSKKLWQPLGMNDDGLWHTDDQGMELTFCCINTNARNFAKFGLLMMNKGKWQNQQLVPAEFINQMVAPLATPGYGLSTWLSYDQEPNFYFFSGLLGQYIVNVPEHNLVIVRLGEKTSPSVHYTRPNSIPNYIRKTYLSYALSLIKQ